ncbi:MAG TPA: hypothetical protein VGL70_20140, partial [Candidatus Binatia bacterium]
MKITAFVAFTLLPFIATTGFSQSTPAQIEVLTEKLLTLSGQYQKAGRLEQPSLLKELVAVAAERQERLASLIAMNPGEVLRLAIASDLRAMIPSQVQLYVEEWVEVDGIVEVLAEDPPGRYLHFLQTSTGRFALHFAGSKTPGLVTGSRIRVKGVR